jgi:hypothetical protein
MMAVLGALESAEKEPVSPAGLLPVPTPAKSRLTLSGSSFSEGKVLATAEGADPLLPAFVAVDSAMRGARGQVLMTGRLPWKAYIVANRF